MLDNILPDKIWRANDQLNRAGFHSSQQRLTLLLAFYSCTEPVSVKELWRLAKKENITIGYQTTSRLLANMVEVGIVSKIQSPDRVTRFRQSKAEETVL